MYQQDDYAAAIDTLVNVTNPGNYASPIEELKGDIYFTQGQFKEAEGAYQEALNTLVDSGLGRRKNLEIKLNDLTGSSDKAEAVK